jgi:hypothetical protein
MHINASSPGPPVYPLTSCPRCDGRRIVALAPHSDSSFAWHECEECRHLWALPSGWTLHPEPVPLPVVMRAVRS